MCLLQYLDLASWWEGVEGLAIYLPVDVIAHFLWRDVGVMAKGSFDEVPHAVLWLLLCQYSIQLFLWLGCLCGVARNAFVPGTFSGKTAHWESMQLGKLHHKPWQSINPTSLTCVGRLCSSPNPTLGRLVVKQVTNMLLLYFPLDCEHVKCMLTENWQEEAI